MNKEQFIGYLEALKELAQEEHFTEDELPDILDRIIDKAKVLQLYTSPTVPYIPWNEPWKPYITWTTNTIKEFTNKIPGPNDWSIDTDDSNWSVKIK